jgi:adenosylhomocysteine nucleosidase
MKIGILSAFGIESRPLRKRLEEVCRTEINGQICYVLRDHDEEVMVVQSGMGKRQGAEGSRVLIDQFSAQAIINCGVAGAISPQRHIGDVVISDQIVEYDAITNPSTKLPTYPSHPQLLRMALQICPSLPAPETILAGTILSGNHVVNSEQEKRKLWDEFQGQCVEQEGAGVARVCESSHIPWIVIRGISDLANGHALEDFQKNAQHAIDNVALVAFELLTMLISLPTMDNLQKSGDGASW